MNENITGVEMRYYANQGVLSHSDYLLMLLRIATLELERNIYSKSPLGGNNIESSILL